MKESKNTNNIGTTFLELLTLLFIALKLLGKITWSWWWVLSPIWITIIIVVIVVLVMFLIEAIRNCK